MSVQVEVEERVKLAVMHITGYLLPTYFIMAMECWFSSMADVIRNVLSPKALWICVLMGRSGSRAYPIFHTNIHAFFKVT